jgi:hypothetical protein
MIDINKPLLGEIRAGIGTDPGCLQTIGCLPGLRSAHSYIHKYSVLEGTLAVYKPSVVCQGCSLHTVTEAFSIGTDPGCLQTIDCLPGLQSAHSYKYSVLERPLSVCKLSVVCQGCSLHTVTKAFSNGMDPGCLQTIGCLLRLQSAHGYISIQYWNEHWLSINHRLSARAAVCTVT